MRMYKLLNRKQGLYTPKCIVPVHPDFISFEAEQPQTSPGKNCIDSCEHTVNVLLLLSKNRTSFPNLYSVIHGVYDRLSSYNSNSINDGASHF